MGCYLRLVVGIRLKFGKRKIQYIHDIKFIRFNVSWRIVAVAKLVHTKLRCTTVDQSIDYLQSAFSLKIPLVLRNYKIGLDWIDDWIDDWIG